MVRLASAFLRCFFYKHFETVLHVKILYIPDSIKQICQCRSGTSTLQICTCVGRTEHLVILLVISRTSQTWGWNFPPFTSFQPHWTMLFWGVFNALPVTLHLPRIRRRQKESEGSFLDKGFQPPNRLLNAYPLIRYFSICSFDWQNNSSIYNPWKVLLLDIP